MITFVKDGRRLYLDYPFHLKDRVKSELGASWDADRRKWWVGSGKLAQVEALALVLRQEAAVVPVTGSVAGLDAGTSAGVVADKLRDGGDDAAADEVLAAALAPAEDLSKCRVYAKVTHKGQTWYVIGEARASNRCRIVRFTGQGAKWVDMADCQLQRAYEGKEVWDGRRYSNQTVMQYMTLGKLQRFVRDQRNPDTARGECSECGHWGPRGTACSECGGEGSHL